MKPIFKDIPQGTEEWHAWRKNGIGASLVTTIINANPYKTAYIAWGEICGFWDEDDLSRNPNVIRGNKYEEEALNLFNRKMTANFKPICVESAQRYPFISSLDGYDATIESVAEIKCPHPNKWQELVKKKRLSEHYRLYYTQVQYQLAVSGAKKGYLVFYNVESKEMLVFAISSNRAYQQWLLAKVQTFWQLCQAKTPPELDLERDVITPELTDRIDLKQWLKIAERLVTLLAEKAELSKKNKVIAEKIKSVNSNFIDLLGGFKQGEIEGVKLAVSNRSGRVDYKAAYEALCEKTQDAVDLSEYQGESSCSYRIAINKKAGEDITKEITTSKRKELLEKLAKMNTLALAS